MIDDPAQTGSRKEELLPQMLFGYDRDALADRQWRLCINVDKLRTQVPVLVQGRATLVGLKEVRLVKIHS